MTDVMWDSIWKPSKQREQHVITFFFHLLKSPSKADIPLDHWDKLAAWLLLPDRTNRFAFQMWLRRNMVRWYLKYSIERKEFSVRDFRLSVRSHLKNLLQFCLFLSLSLSRSLLLFISILLYQLEMTDTLKAWKSRERQRWIQREKTEYERTDSTLTL